MLAFLVALHHFSFPFLHSSPSPNTPSFPNSSPAPCRHQPPSRQRNNARVRGAGRPWSKTFTDPNKVFVGNLPYDADEADVARLFADHWNISEEAVGDRLASVKVVRDWRSGRARATASCSSTSP